MTADAFKAARFDSSESNPVTTFGLHRRDKARWLAGMSSTEGEEPEPLPSRHTDRGEHVCIIVLNWNGWQDTIECLESLLRLSYPSYTVVVCDNASSDDSWDQIHLWASGNLTASCTNPKLAHLTSPPVAKPVPSISYSSPQASLSSLTFECSLVLIQTGGNLGFAGGNNVGLRYALSQTDCEYFWLLNNDTVVEADALSRMVEQMSVDQRVGICGSVLLDYTSPQTVQAFGGKRYGAWSGRILDMKHATQPSPQSVSNSMDYVHGASMLVRREFLQTIGLMDEGYFLYFEEMDWAMRSRGRFRLGYAPLSIVYHKEGASIGTHARRQKRSLLAERYATRNRLLFTRKFHPALVPSVLCFVALTFVHRLLAGDPRRAGQIVAAAWEGLTCPKQPCVDMHSVKSGLAVPP